MRPIVKFLARLSGWLERHWLATLVAILLTYGLLPFAAPVLKWLGLDGAAQLIYQPYKLTCHTYGFRSFFLFGERFVYDRETFEQLSGISASGSQYALGLLRARDFQGNPRMGYKVALCQRDIAIYVSMGLGGVAYSLARHRARPMPFWLFVALGVLPIGLDGFSQLLSQPPFGLLPYRESNWILRLITGGLFGFSVAWLIFPLLDGAAQPVQRPAQPVAKRSL
jgi:uncharacterized membrane protein